MSANVDMKSQLDIVQTLQAKDKPHMGQIKASDGLSLNYAAYLPDKPISTLLFYHGGGAHGQAGYTLMAENLSKKFSVATYLFDIRGHGKSEGARGDCDSTNQVWKDVSSSIDFVMTKHKDIPLFLGGHSSGAGLVLNYCSWNKQAPVSGCIMVAPELGYCASAKRDKDNGFVKVYLSSILTNRFTGGYLAQKNIAVEFAYPPEHVNEHNVVTQYTVNMSLALTPSDPKKFFSVLAKPTRIFIAGEDEMIDPEKLKVFLAPLRQLNQRLHFQTIPKCGHLSILKDIHNFIGASILNEINPRKGIYFYAERKFEAESHSLSMSSLENAGTKPPSDKEIDTSSLILKDDANPACASE